jgi:ATP-dependent exoDNAse (exonuclease V) alpha subunit
MAWADQSKIPREMCDWAWALTIHKAQRSEFENVYLFFFDRGFLNSLPVLYTGLTRAKVQCTIIATMKPWRLVCAIFTAAAG